MGSPRWVLNPPAAQEHLHHSHILATAILHKHRHRDIQLRNRVHPLNNLQRRTILPRLTVSPSPVYLSRPSPFNISITLGPLSRRMAPLNRSLGRLSKHLLYKARELYKASSPMDQRK